MMRLTFLILIALVVGFQRSSAQILESVELGRVCTMFGEAPPARLTLFAADKQAQDAVGRILGTVGLERNFEIRAAGVPNAAAEIKGTRRFIFYSQTFFERTKSSTGTDWGPISILAHEVGHHLQGHTLDRVGSRPKEELEADSWSGFVLQKMGASLNDAQAAMTRFSSDVASDSHPAKHDRLAAIANGWRRACENDEKCRTGQSTSRPTPTPTPTPTPAPTPSPTVHRALGPDSCEYARDAECDEPSLCDVGTDTTDCRVPRINFATSCVTVLLACPMGVQIPVGSACFCPTLFGPINGLAQ
jgi:hypothetical protein